MNLQSDDFELFGLERRFHQEAAVIDTRWKDLQRLAHPDRFTDRGQMEQRVAMQWSVRINEAYQRLKNPIQRAIYLCALHGVSVEGSHGLPLDFLQEHLEYREALENAAHTEELHEIQQKILETKRGLLQRIEYLIDVKQDFHAAAEPLRMLMFVERLDAEVQKRSLLPA